MRIEKIKDRRSHRISSLDPRSSILYLLSSILSAIHCDISGSNNTVEADPRLTPVTPSPSGVEELYAVYGPLVAAQINGARLAPGGDTSVQTALAWTNYKGAHNRQFEYSARIAPHK